MLSVLDTVIGSRDKEKDKRDKPPHPDMAGRTPCMTHSTPVSTTFVVSARRPNSGKASPFTGTTA